MAVNAVFYPCLTYNVDEGLGDNHYNCPVVADVYKRQVLYTDSVSNLKLLLYSAFDIISSL